MAFRLDTNQKTQVNNPQMRRTIYDARSSEIFWKSLLAGFSLGLGQTLATVLFFGVIAGLLLTWVSPLLSQFDLPLNDLQIILQQPLDSTGLINLPTPATTTQPTTSPTTTTSVGE